MSEVPLVRIICAEHRGRTVGRIIGDEGHPVYLAPSSYPFVRYLFAGLYLDQDVLEAIGVDDVPAMPAYCPDCRTRWSIPIEALRAAAGGSAPVLVLRVESDGGAVLELPRRGQ